MKKQIALGSAFAVALGLAACTPPAESEGEAATEETVETVEEAAPDAEAAVAEGEGDAATGLDENGNPIHD